MYPTKQAATAAGSITQTKNRGTLLEDIIKDMSSELQRQAEVKGIDSVKPEEINPFEAEEYWDVVLYSRVERGFDEIAVMLELETTPDEAFGIFNEIVSAYPPQIVILDAMVSELDRHEYEVRLIRKKNRRVVAVVQWNDDLIKQCMKDWEVDPPRSYVVTMNVTTPPGMPEDPTEWDWAFLHEAGFVELINADLTESDDDAIITNK
jgi:hypothetical protein